jgi:sulfotransferase family protein
MPPPSTERLVSPPPIFVGGAGRSGTTLLRVILDSHSNIACGPELKVTPNVCGLWYEFQSGFFPALVEYGLTRQDISRAMGDLISTLLAKYRATSGKPRSAEKSPNNVFYFAHLHTIFPESPLVHMVRDGRDVVCSLLTMDWVDSRTGAPIDYTRDARKAAEYWVSAVRAGREAGRRIGAKHYREIKYEDVVARPDATLRSLFEFLGEPWEDTVLRFHEDTSRSLANESSADQVSKPLYATASGRWVQDLKPADKAAVKSVAGDLLVELGYAANKDW